jgi:hypothetical protein
MRALSTVAGWLAAIWGIPSGASTVFLYLSSGHGWDTTLAYMVSLLAMIPLLGGTVAAFMAEPITGWTFWHAFFNFNGWIILLAIGLIGGLRAKNDARVQKKDAIAAAPPGE